MCNLKEIVAYFYFDMPTHEKAKFQIPFDIFIKNIFSKYLLAFTNHVICKSVKKNLNNKNNFCGEIIHT